MMATDELICIATFSNEMEAELAVRYIVNTVDRPGLPRVVQAGFLGLQISFLF
mgnify:CR=1 FL=1